MIYYISFFISGLGTGIFLDVLIEYLIKELSIREGFKNRPHRARMLAVFLTAIIFVLLLKKYSLTIEYFTAIFLMSLLIAVSIIDLKFMKIPNKLVVVGLLGSSLLLAYSLFTHKHIFGERWQEHFCGIFSGSGFLLLVAIVGKAIFKGESIGMGDIKIYFPIGILLGWKLCMVSVFFAIAVAGIVNLVLLVAGKKKIKSSVPFGPFVAVGTLVALLWGQEIIKGCFF